ncbi:MAG: tRNA uridine-5-carboxymethylaminomethyl(34) synthesis GTPase MnmE [Bacteroidales bacterium]|nr:tRNA uridine-5-carboxymethylaminomethyl(34) synthesis GTPase MnmE [Bacteroidales bacterium]
MINTDTICAIATSPGIGAIAVIRVSGSESFKICEKMFSPRKKNLRLSQAKSHSIHFGTIGDKNNILDEVLLSVFKAPNSYTGEDSVEISCHGSIYIQQKIQELLIKNGARHAKPGEFTLRGFLNAKFDLSQSEAVADLIASNSEASHHLAIDQMRGGFSQKIKELRAKLLEFASLIELELDFSEEDLEFAERPKLMKLLKEIENELKNLTDSFSVGNVLKTGIPVAIIGKPNVGKSTLLNALLNEEKAIVSDIPGTTRDAIEDTIVIEGISFRFIDTAGLRSAENEIESIGIERTYEKINQASVILYLFDISIETPKEIIENLNDFKDHINNKNKKFILIGNKTDKLIETPHGFKDLVELETIYISAKRKENINLISESLVKSVNFENISDKTLVSNIRHYEALSKSLQAIKNIEEDFKNEIPTDLISTDIRDALHHLGEITGEITTNEILDSIFRKFCIGK